MIELWEARCFTMNYPKTAPNQDEISENAT